MLVYRVERRFCTRLKDDIKTYFCPETKDVKLTANIMWNRYPRSVYGRSYTDTSHETLEWLKSQGIDIYGFKHSIDLTDERAPLPQNELKMIQEACDYFEVLNKSYLPNNWERSFYFAFASLEQAYEWFDKDDRDLLATLGYYIAVYEVSYNEVLKGGKQVMFNRKKSCQVDCIYFE